MSDSPTNKSVRPKRPVDLGVGTILRNNANITSFVSIIHRVTGIVLFAGVGYFLYLLDRALASPSSFESMLSDLNEPCFQFLSFVFLSSLAYHLVAGVKHIFMDMGAGETKESGPVLAWIALVVAVVLVVFIGGFVYG